METPTRLLQLLPKLLRHADSSDESREQAVFAAWIIIVGSQIRRVTRPLRLERRALLVAVPDATWRTQLKSIAGHALFKINSLLGAAAVTTIEFVVNPDAVKLSTASPQHPVTFVAYETQALPLREKAGGIPNPGLREAFLRAAGKCLERRAR